MPAIEDSTLYMSPQNAELDNFNDYTPDLDYLDGDGSFDFDNADLGGEMIGALPGTSAANAHINGDGHEKRKNPDEDTEVEESDAKRQETQENGTGAKKPGRKPLTSEPTTKRKAQNRAAQRAFRERKEKHLKDLETTVAELNKAKEADKHENGLLKAQVERLQVELREYRKRLSLNGGASRSPTLQAYGTQNRSNSGSNYGNNDGFQFDFPKFGGLPGSQIFGNTSYTGGAAVRPDSTTPPVTSRSPTAPTTRENSLGSGLSPQSVQSSAPGAGSPDEIAHLFPSVGYSTNDNMHGFASTLPQMHSHDPFGDLFTPSILKSANMDGNNFFANPQHTNSASNAVSADIHGGESTAGLNRVFQFNSNSSVSDTASPSNSSFSQWNTNGTGNSSCGTSPEPSQFSPKNKDNKMGDNPSSGLNPAQNLNGANDFGNIQTGINSADLGVPLAHTFDPVLFGDYRETNDNLISGTDFTGGFFDEALHSAPFDFNSPSNLFGILQSPQQTNAALQANNAYQIAPTPSSNLMAKVDKTCGGGDDDQIQPAIQQKKESGKLISCNKIWNQLQSNSSFQDGKFDLDALCSELRSKARCSESGVMVDQDHVSAALKRLAEQDEKANAVEPAATLMFEQESWDDVLKKLSDSSTRV